MLNLHPIYIIGILKLQFSWKTLDWIFFWNLFCNQQTLYIPKIIAIFFEDLASCLDPSIQAGFFFDEILPKTESNFDAKLRDFPKTEKYEIYRSSDFCSEFWRRQKMGIYCWICLNFGTFYAKFMIFWPILMEFEGFEWIFT